MKKLSGKQITLMSIGIVAVLLILWVMGSYNGLVKADETVNEKWANVGTAYQRRADLVPNLVETVKRYAAHEETIFIEVTKARASMMNAKTPTELQAADNQLSSTLKTLFAVAENYPNLKANENFLSLQDELAGTENRIKTERDIYNGAVKELNLKIRRFPTNIIAGIFGFEKRDMFEAQQGAEEAVDVGKLF
ncbi:MAG: LemA family protein [Nanoarchaeota archaeon]|nr:LemA family protein [Nanoarchaeota archaeon]